MSICPYRRLRAYAFLLSCFVSLFLDPAPCRTAESSRQKGKPKTGPTDQKKDASQPLLSSLFGCKEKAGGGGSGGGGGGGVKRKGGKAGKAGKGDRNPLPKVEEEQEGDTLERIPVGNVVS